MLGLFKAAKAVRQVKILSVDDDTSVRETLRDRLVRQGWDVAAVCDGHQALAAAAENKPDVVLLDIHMPQMDGLTALECFRRDPDLSDVPVMMVTGSSQVSDISRAASCNVADYVTKPFNATDLVTRVEQVLRRTQRSTTL